ncbi:MAG: hypothetical protein ACK4VW_08660 [Anaerolineales bacterium]
MNVGMLWFDNDPHTPLLTKVQRAVEYYRRKYGREPNLCLVHPGMYHAQDSQMPSGGITIRPYRSILPNHFWIGLEENGHLQQRNSSPSDEHGPLSQGKTSKVEGRQRKNGKR